jgi:hypothetical protein
MDVSMLALVFSLFALAIGYAMPANGLRRMRDDV